MATMLESDELADCIRALRARRGLSLEQVTALALLSAMASSLVPGDFVRCLRPAPQLRVLHLAVTLLPPGERARWAQEWAGELDAVATRRGRIRFSLSLLLRGAPQLAVTLRRGTQSRPAWPGS
jgi:hypothetical protein